MHGGQHVVGADEAHALHGGPRRRGEGSLDAVVDGDGRRVVGDADPDQAGQRRVRWRAGRWPPGGGRGTPCGRSRPRPGSRSPPARRGGPAARGCGAGPCRSRSPGRSTARRRRRPAPPRPGRRGARAPRSRRPRRSGPAASSAGRPACAWRPNPRPSPAATSWSVAEMSLTMVAPAATAATAVASFRVSTETRPWSASASITGSTRRCSSAGSTGSAPGRVDSPPTSTMAAPAANRSIPWAIALAGSNQRPPSENESGVTLTHAHDLRLHEGARVLGPVPPTRARTGPIPARLARPRPTGGDRAGCASARPRPARSPRPSPSGW